MPDQPTAPNQHTLHEKIRRTLAEADGFRYEDLEPHDYAKPAHALVALLTRELKADWSRYRGRVLQEAWEALRDTEGGPLIDGMNVINKLLEKK